METKLFSNIFIFVVVELPIYGFGEINKEIINLNIGLSDLIKLATDQNDHLRIRNFSI